MEIATWLLTMVVMITTYISTVPASTVIQTASHTIHLLNLSLGTTAEFWAEPRNLPISAEFLCFHRILRGTNTAYFGRVQVAVLYVDRIWFRHEIHDYHSGSDGRNTENIELSLSEILAVYFVRRLYLSVAVTGNKYCILGWVQGDIEN